MEWRIRDEELKSAGRRRKMLLPQQPRAAHLSKLLHASEWVHWSQWPIDSVFITHRKGWINAYLMCEEEGTLGRWGGGPGPVPRAGSGGGGAGGGGLLNMGPIVFSVYSAVPPFPLFMY